MTEWRRHPIETYRPGTEFVLIWFDDDPVPAVARRLADDLPWTDEDGLDFDYGAADRHVTHWMPLPPASEPGCERARWVFVFPNGQIATCDRQGRQIPELQGADTPELRAAIKAHAEPDLDWNEYAK